MSSPSDSHATDLWPDDEEDGSYHTATEQDREEEEDDSEFIFEAEDQDDDDDDDEDGTWGEGQNGGDDDDDEEEENDDSDEDGSGQPVAISDLTPRELLMLLTVHNLGSHLLTARIERGGGVGRFLRARRQREETQFPDVPSKAGRELMASGAFGSNTLAMSPQAAASGRSMTLPRRLLDRELGMGDVFTRKLNRNLMMQGMIPSSKPDMVMRFPEPVYSGQFSDDGNFFYAVGKDFKVRMYDTSNPYKWRYYKTAHFPYGNWTLTDASLSPDNRWLAISSLLPDVCLAPTDPNDKGDPYVLDLSESGGTGRDQGGPFESHRSRGSSRHFGIFSLRYSGDGRELVAGVSRGGVVVYDIESRRVLHRIDGHDKDVNAVCFAAADSPHILYSGSDDATIKVWDRRSMADGREAGAFVGHVNGLTYLDSKGDGRYILSNGKDHSMKLWDLRMAMSSADFAKDDPRRYTRDRIIDYRYRDFDEDDYFQHPRDNSVVTFRGHKINTTLIRCHFSPPGSTNSRYVYSGSADGKVYVWNLDATPAAEIEVAMTAAVAMNTDGLGRHAIVREAHWHPNAPLLVSSSMRGYGFGFCSVHSYNESKDDEDDPQRGRVVDSMLKPWIQTDEEPDADEHWW